MQFIFNDGGRNAAGYKGKSGDCVCRAIAIASGRSYSDVYSALSRGMGAERKSRGASARNGIHVSRKWFKDLMQSWGFTWTPTMKIGSGCQVHLTEDELPKGRLVVAVSKHYTAVIDGVIHDTFNPSDRPEQIFPENYPQNLLPKKAVKLENGNGFIYAPKRCVYGYWMFKS